jgi:hypothetical protein
LPSGLDLATLKQAKQFVDGHHGILVQESVNLAGLLDAPEIYACFYTAGWRATFEVALARKIAVPCPTSSSKSSLVAYAILTLPPASDGKGNADMVTQYAGGPRGPHVDHDEKASVYLVRHALDELYKEASTVETDPTHPGFQKHADALYRKLVPDEEHAAVKLGTDCHHSAQHGAATPPRAASAAHPAADRHGTPSDHLLQAIARPKEAFTFPARLKYGTKADRAVRERLVHSIFQRLGRLDSKPATHA